MRVQLQQYLNDVHNQPNPKTLFIIWIGGNDVLNDLDKLLYLYENSKMSKVEIYRKTAAFLNDQRGVALKNDQNIHFSFPVYNIHEAVKHLVKQGVSLQQIYVVNLPDLSAAPAAQEKTNHNRILLDALHVITDLYNLHLYWALTSDKTLHFPRSHIIPVYDLQEKIFKNPKQYGFTNLKDSCVTNKADPICQGYFFFNTLHPTAPSGRLIASDFSRVIVSSQTKY